MEKLSGLNRDEQATILMVTHDSNAASFCKRILFIQEDVYKRQGQPRFKKQDNLWIDVDFFTLA